MRRFPDPFLLHAGGRIRLVNAAGLRLLGAAREEEILGRPILDCIHPEDRDDARGWIGGVAEAGFQPPREARLVRVDGSTVGAEVLALPVVGGRRTATLVLIRDATGRPAAGEGRWSPQRLLLEAERVGRTGSWEWDIASDVVCWSDGLYRIFGLRPWQRTPTYEGFLRRVHAADRDAARAAVDRAVREGSALEHEFRVVREDGSERVVRSRAEIVLDGGRAVRMIGISEDVTERRRAEGERALLLERERQARAAVEAALARLHAIQRVTDATLACLHLADLLREILGRLRSVLAADTASVLLLEEDRATLVVRASQGLEEEVARGARVPVGEGIAGRVAARQEAMIVEDVSAADTLRPLLRERVRSLMGVPLLVEGVTIGVLEVGRFQRRRFTPEDLELLQMVADRVAPEIERVRLFEEVRGGRERLRDLSRRLVETQESERRGIARELHDEIGQLLTGLRLLMEGHEASGPGTPLPGETLARMKGLVNDIMGRVRSISMELRPPMLDDLGLLPALVWHSNRFSDLTRVRIDLRHAGLDRRFPPEIETAAYRIVQEALTNVARHAGAGQAIVDLRADAEYLHLSVEDRGQGFDPRWATARGSCGLTGMVERASLLGGRLRIDSAPGSGTRVSAELPLPRGVGEEARP